MPDVVSVVGGGYSFKQVNQNKLPGIIIAANEAAILLPRVNHAVSMDRLWVENRIDKLRARKDQTWLRRSAVQNIEWLNDGDWLRVFDNDHKSVTFSEDPQTLNGTSSGTCALNLAYILRPVELYLFGFDMGRDGQGNPYWHEPYAWSSKGGGTSNGKYKTWAAEFNEIALAFASVKTNVFNVSMTSKIGCWRKIAPKEIGLGL